MADKKISELTAITSVSADDLLIVVDDPTGTAASNKITVADFFTVVVPLQANDFILTNNSTPANSTPSIAEGSFFFDTGFLYIAVADNTLKRVALSTF